MRQREICRERSGRTVFYWSQWRCLSWPLVVTIEVTTTDAFMLNVTFSDKRGTHGKVVDIDIVHGDTVIAG